MKLLLSAQSDDFFNRIRENAAFRRDLDADNLPPAPRKSGGFPRRAFRFS